MANKILWNIHTAGIIKIVFGYKDGNIVVYDISSYIRSEVFFLQNFSISSIYNTIVECLISKNIDKMVREYKIKEELNFYQRIVFSLKDDQNIKIEDITKKKVFDKFKVLFGK